jgi:hypothetical protein
MYSKKNAEYIANTSASNENNAMTTDNNSSTSMEIIDPTKYVYI